MVIQGLVIVIVGVIAWIWGSRGFFSSLLHLLCVLVAGAVAFGLWEPVAYLILGQTGNQRIVSLAWGAALAVPFAATLAIIRPMLDKAVPNNADLDPATNLVGGIACGAVSGTITAGIVVLSIGMLGVGSNFGMFQPIQYQPNGSLVRKDRLWYPADRITTWLYGYTSEASFRTGTPLNVWRPHLADDGQLLRTNFNGGTSRQVIRPSAFKMTGRYTVGEKNQGLTVKDLLSDSLTGDFNKDVTTIDGDSINKNAKGYFLQGFIVEFTGAAREKDGRVVFGNGQARLVCRDEGADKSISLQPVALVSQANQTTPDRIDYGRWKYDAGETFIASVGGGADPKMAFEFLVPRGYSPLALYVKGARVDLRGGSSGRDYADSRDRDAAIRNRGAIMTGGAGGGSAGTTGSAPKRGTGTVRVQFSPSTSGGPFRIFDSFDGGVLNRDNIKGLQIDTETRFIINGEARFTSKDLDNRGMDRNLQVRQFAATDDTVIVQVSVSMTSELGPVVNEAAATAVGQPVLIDTLKQRYEPIGFTYRDTTEFSVRFLPGSPIGSIQELPNGGPSRSRPDQTFWLLYRVTNNVKLDSFVIGETVVGIFDPQVEIKKNFR